MAVVVWMDSPIGWISLTAGVRGLRSVSFEDAKGEDDPEPPEFLTEARKQLQEYFEGKRTEFDIPVEPEGTEFQEKIWQLLQAIPFGETRSYGQLAHALKNPGAIRAVGAANGANPIAIILPCHRVIGSDGKLTGYAGGIHRKEWLLAFEARHDKKGQQVLF